LHKKPDKYLKLNIVLNKKKSLTIRNCQVPIVFLRAIKDIFPPIEFVCVYDIF